MALLNKFRKFHRFQILAAIKCSALQCSLRSKSIAVDIDVLDNFTTQLVQKKSDKWESVKVKKQLPTQPLHEMTKSVANLIAKQMTTNEIDRLCQEIVDENDVNKLMHLLNECLTYKKCPCVSVLVNVLSFLSQNGRSDGIQHVRQLCENSLPDFLNANSNFDHYIAEARWVKGNISKALLLFEEVYRKNTFLRRRIRLMLKVLLFDAVTNHSEAILVNVIKFTEVLASDFKDYYPLTCLWQVCFLSEWYSDQCVALELLERNSGLCKAVVNQIPYVVSTSLKYHKTEPVYRLLEILLKYESKNQYMLVLMALFDYRLRQGDLLSCIEICHWANKNNLIMPPVHHEKFLNLLLKHNIHLPGKKSKSVVSDYQLKF